MMNVYSGCKVNKHEFGAEFCISTYIMDNLLNIQCVNGIICKIRYKLKYSNLTLRPTHAATEEKR